MPNRIIRDGILTSERINALSPAAELFYRRLMSIVDDYGRSEAHPKILLAKCYPLQIDKVTEQDIFAWLTDVSHDDRHDDRHNDRHRGSHNDGHCDGQALDPLVTLYEIKGKKYLQINSFGQRQRTESKCPGPPENGFDGHVDRHLAADCGSRALARRASTPTPPSKCVAVSEELFEDWFERQYARHPNKKDKTPAARVAADHFSQGRFVLDEFERRHVAWCATETWQWKNGARAPTFGQWVTDEGYRYDAPVESVSSPGTAMEAAANGRVNPQLIIGPRGD